MTWSEDRKQQLEDQIGTSLALLKEHEDKLRLSDDPKEQVRARREIESLRTLIATYQAELEELSGSDVQVAVSQAGGLASDLGPSVVELRKLLINQFDLEEIRSLCLELGIDYDTLRGEGKAAKMRELVLQMLRRGRLGHLIAEVQEVRSDKAIGLEVLESEQLWERVAGYSGEDFSSVTRIIHNMLRYSLQSKPLDVYDEFNRLILYLLDLSPLGEGLKLPSALPVIFVRNSQFNRQDIVDVPHLLQKRRGIWARTALTVLFLPQEQCRPLKATLKEMSRAYGLDFVLAGRQEILDVVSSSTPQRMLLQLLLSQIDLLTVSPYAVVGPVPDQMFFGRERELREIAEYSATRSFAILGGRRIGKTSMLGHLHRVRLPAGGFCTVYHDCSATPTYRDFLQANIHEWHPEPRPKAPVTIGDLLQSPPDDRPLVLLLDEADKLVPADREAGWPLFNALRALANSGRTQVVLSGERTLSEALQDAHSPLFNFANEMLIGQLDFRAVEELVMQPMKQLEIELVDEATIVRRIYGFTSGHPSVVQRLCQRLIVRLSRRGDRRLTPDDVAAVLDDPAFQRDDFLGTYWESATPLEKIISLLMADDQRVRTLGAVRQTLAERCNLRCDAQEVSVALQGLVDLRSILQRRPDGYSFVVEAFPQVVADTMTLRDMLGILVEEYTKRG